ncbi:hypothetical protein [Streptomyces acidicola]|uniref:hypothetical protein n=1 Tax=Streptomyces acidicola TaxID=2596892 RepID=UPI0034342606
MQTLPLRGLGAELAVIERLIGPRPDLLAILYQLTPPRSPGRPKTLNDVQNFPGPPAPVEETPAVSATRKKAAGNNVENIMRKLAKDRPDLLEEVTAGRMKAYAAAVEAGWRKPQTTIPLTDPETIARKLFDKLGSEQAQPVCAALTQLVVEPDNDT